MVLGSLAFALMGAFTHALRYRCDWQVIVLARAALQLTFALALARAGGVRLLVWRPGLLWVRSVGGSVSMVCMFYAYTRLPVADVLTLANTFPIWVALLSWPLLRRRPSTAVWLAVASGVLGVALMLRPHFAAANLASLLALASSVFTAVAMIALHRLRRVDPRAVIVHFSAVALALCVASLFLFDRAFSPGDVWHPDTLLLLLGVGAAAMTGQLFLTWAYAVGEAAGVSVVGLTQIVFAMAFDVLLFGHTFGPATLLGVALVVAPTAWLMASRGG
jgi:drug/metabolite transporter (DMT)-like permease